MGDFCGFKAKEGPQGVEFGGQANDPKAFSVDNPCSANQFRVAMIFRLSTFPAANKIAQIFSYSTKIKLNINSFATGVNELKVVKVDEGVAMAKAMVGKAPRWIFVWLEVSEGKTEIAVRQTYPWRLSEDVKMSYTHSKCQILKK